MPSFVVVSEYIKGQIKGSECHAGETVTKVPVGVPDMVDNFGQ